MTHKLILGIIFGAFLLLPDWGLGQHTAAYHSPDYFFEKGNQLLNKEKYFLAQENFQTYTRLQADQYLENTILSYYYIALCALRLGTKDADVLLNEFVNKYPSHPKAISAYLAWGSQYFEEGDFDKSIEYLEKVNPERLTQSQREERNFKLAKSYFFKEEYKKAKQILNELKSGYSRYAQAASYYAGYIAYKEGDLEEALVDLKKASLEKEFETLTPVIISHIYYQTENYLQLINYTQPFLASNRDLHQIEDIYLLTGHAYFYQRSYDQALSNFRQYLGLAKSQPDPLVLYLVGFCEFQQQSYQKAIESLEPIANQDNARGQQAAYYLGLSYLQLDQKRFAATALEQAQNRPYDLDIIQESTWQLAKIYYDLDRYTESIDYLKTFIDKYPQDNRHEEALDLLGKAYLYSNQYEEALAYIESLPQRNASINRAYQQISYSQGVEAFNEGLYPNAVRFFDKTIQNPPINDLALAAKFWMAEAYVLGNAPEVAIPIYQEFLDLSNPGNPYIKRAHYGLAYAYYNTSQYGLAIPHLQYYISRTADTDQPNYKVDALVRLADCHAAQKEYTQALRYYDQIIQLNFPDRDYAFFQKGQIFSLSNNNELAQQNFDAIINQYPNSIYYDQALYEKGNIELKANSFAIAINTYTQLIQEKPNSSLLPDVLLRRGLAYQNIGNNDAAVEDYKRIVNDYATHPNASSALFSLQNILIPQGRQGELNALIARYQAANPNSQAGQRIYFENAKTAYFNQDYAAAINQLENYLQNYAQSPFAPDARYFLGESYYRSNNIASALYQHKLVLQEQKSSFQSRSARRVATLSFAQKDYREAITYYYLLSAIAENKREKSLAWLGLVESYYEIPRYDSLSYYADLLIAQTDVTGSKYRALLFKGKAAYRMQQYQNAIQIFQEVSSELNDETGAEAQYSLAEIYYVQKRYDTSLETLFDLNKKFNYERWRGRSFLLIADNYIALNETFQAKATLESIIEKSPDAEVVEKARQKLASLK